MSYALLFLIIALAAGLYASVGHGGASAYLAILTLAGMAHPDIAVTVLLMNLIVSATAFRRYQAAGHFDGPLAASLIVFSAPAAFLGGLAPVSPRLFALLLGIALLAAGVRLLLPNPQPEHPAHPQGPGLWKKAALMGSALGLLAGLTGVGGGIYLSPLLLLMGWAGAKRTAAVSAAFIFVNSATGLIGRLLRGQEVEPALLPLVVAALAGGLLGACWGAGRARNVALCRVLGVVLLIAAAKLLYAP